MSSLQERMSGTTSTWWIVLLEGIVTLIFGLLLLFSPTMALLILVQFVGIYWLISGLFAIVEIFAANRTAFRGWLLFYGIIGILAGLAVLRYPLVSMILIPTVLVVFLGITGILMGIISLVHGIAGPGSVNDRERKMLKGRERIAQRRREEEKEAKIRKKSTRRRKRADGSVLKLVIWQQ